MARTDVVIVVPSRPIALRTLLAVMLAITLALSLVVPSGGAPAAADEGLTSESASFEGLHDLIRVTEVRFAEQPVDAVLSDADTYPTYPVTASGTPTTGDPAPVTVEWEYERTSTHTAVTDGATAELRHLAIAALNERLIEVASGTFETTHFTTEASETIATAFASEATASITTESVATQLDIAIDEAIQVATPSLVAWDIATPGTDLTTTATADTDVAMATGTTPTVTTAFGTLEVEGPLTRRRVELRFDVPEELSIEPLWQFVVSVDLPLVTETVATTSQTVLTLADPATSTTPTTITATASLDTELRNSLSGDADSGEFRLWEQDEPCDEAESCEAEIRGPVDESDVRVTVRSVDGAQGRLLLGWLGDREVPGATGTISSWNAQLTCNGVEYQGLPGTILFDAPGVAVEKLVTVQVPRSIVQRDTNNGRAQYDVCFLGDDGLAARDGSDVAIASSERDGPDRNAEPFLLPTCGERDDSGAVADAPCIESRTAVRSVGSLPREWRSTLRGGLELMIRLPAGDPMFR